LAARASERTALMITSARSIERNEYRDGDDELPPGRARYEIVDGRL